MLHCNVVSHWLGAYYTQNDPCMRQGFIMVLCYIASMICNYMSDTPWNVSVNITIWIKHFRSWAKRVCVIDYQHIAGERSNSNWLKIVDNVDFASRLQRYGFVKDF